MTTIGPVVSVIICLIKIWTDRRTDKQTETGDLFLRTVGVFYFIYVREVKTNLFVLHILNILSDKIKRTPRKSRHPKCSDISLIENVWDVLGRKLPNLPHPSEPLGEFRHQVYCVDDIIRLMPGPVRECNCTSSGHKKNPYPV